MIANSVVNMDVLLEQLVSDALTLSVIREGRVGVGLGVGGGLGGGGVGGGGGGSGRMDILNPY